MTLLEAQFLISFSCILNIEQQSFTLSENVKKLINNRTENLTRLREQRKNCYTEMKAFRNDLNKFLDKIEDEFFNELSMLEREQIENFVVLYSANPKVPYFS
jgi:archaellum component FlaC